MEQQMLSLQAPVGSIAPPAEAFDWRADDSIVLGYQPATAIYRNACNAIVIRQEGTGHEDDHFIILRDAEAALIIIAGLKAEIQEGGGIGG